MVVVADYNPYSRHLSVSFDGQMAPAFSSISQMDGLPFASWANRIFNEISMELNGASYEFVYLGRRIEADVLSQIVKTIPSCRNFIAKSQEFSLSAVQRIASINRMVMNGLISVKHRGSMTLVIKTNVPVSENGIIPRTAIVKGNVILVGLKDAVPACDECICVCCNQAELNYAKTNCPEAVCVYIGMCEAGITVDEGTPLFSCTEDTLLLMMRCAFEYSGALKLLDKCIECINPESVSENNMEYKALKSTDSILNVRFPGFIDVGEKAEIQYSVYPSTAAKPNLMFRISNPSVLQIDENNVVLSLSEGQANIQVAAQGRNRLLGDFVITCVQKTKVEMVSIMINEYTVSAGTETPIKVTLKPENADNTSELRFISSDPLTAYVDDRTRTLIARNAGECEITARCGKAEAKIYVDVRPKCVAINIETDSDTVIVNEAVKFRMYVTPTNALPPKLHWTTVPENAVLLDTACKMLCVKQEGTVAIHFHDENGNRCSLTLHGVLKTVQSSMTAEPNAKEKKKGFFYKLFS